MDGNFVLGQNVAGNIYVKKGIQSLAGKTVVPTGFEMRATDPEKSVKVLVEGLGGCRQPLSLCYFSQHPPVEDLRKKAVEV